MEPDLTELIRFAEETVDQIEGLKGYGNLVLKIKKLAGTLAAELEWMALYESNPSKHTFVPGKQAKIKKLQMDLEKAIQDVEKKSQKGDDEQVELSPVEKRAYSLIEVVLAAGNVIDPSQPVIDSHAGQMLALCIPEVYERYIHNPTTKMWYVRSGPFLQQVDEAVVIDAVRDAWIKGGNGRIVGTAKRLARMNPDIKPEVSTVLETWDRLAQDADNLYKGLEKRASLKIDQAYIPIEWMGTIHILNRTTGTIDADVLPEGSYVLLPPVKYSLEGESRALDELVAHHFKTEEEVNAFYRTCGISLFGYKVPNLVFLLGSGGSGKDMLFTLMRSVHGPEQTCEVNPLALKKGGEESNDLVRLDNARFALCSHESSSYGDGAFDPATLKTITSGGLNPIMSREKYGVRAVKVYYTGSLWLYGNKAPDITGNGDFDGMDRRFTIMPMTEKLPDKPPPSGFTLWEDALLACSPVFAARCLESFIAWCAEGQKGKQDVRERVPNAWREMTDDTLVVGSRYGSLRKILFPDGGDEEKGLLKSTIFDVLEVFFEKNGGRNTPKSSYEDILQSVMPKECSFVGFNFMEPVERPGQRGVYALPLMFAPSVLEELVGGDAKVRVQHILKADPGWNREWAQTLYESYQKTQTHLDYRPDRKYKVAAE
jgi:hypothetical protein